MILIVILIVVTRVVGKLVVVKLVVVTLVASNHLAGLLLLLACYHAAMTTITPLRLALSVFLPATIARHAS